MPFRKHAKITVTNDSDKTLPLFTYQIDYRLSPVPADAGYFHAQWRRATVNPAHHVYTILEGVKGRRALCWNISCVDTIVDRLVW